MAQLRKQINVSLGVIILLIGMLNGGATVKKVSITDGQTCDTKGQDKCICAGKYPGAQNKPAECFKTAKCVVRFYQVNKKTTESKGCCEYKESKCKKGLQIKKVKPPAKKNQPARGSTPAKGSPPTKGKPPAQKNQPAKGKPPAKGKKSILSAVRDRSLEESAPSRLVL